MSGPLIDLNGRVRDRAREARQRRVRLIVRLGAAAVVLAALVWVAVASPVFSVKRVEIVGNKVVSAETIAQTADVPMGVPLARVDTAGMTKRLSALPGLVRSDVSVTLPDKVVIRVVERQVAFVVDQSGTNVWIDATGVRFGASAERPAGVPVAEASLDDVRLLADIATVLGGLPARLSSKVDRVSAETRDSITVRLSDGTKIVWGSSDASSLKGQLADGFKTAVPTCKVIDVSSPTQPTTRC